MCLNICLVSTKHQLKKNEISMNFIDRNELDLIYYDIDFLGGPSEKTDYLMNDENIVTE